MDDECGRFVEPSLVALYGDGNVHECAFVQSKLTELPFFASKIKLGRKRVEAMISADLQNPTDYESNALQALKPGAEVFGREETLNTSFQWNNRIVILASK
ncbi:hypothetical protein QJS04_geneDACA019478 [Acorus gramineus]|uniref:Uncharacterized protein n=1 Tax=Acorus gramineus TaxID=55184 RepID=A0AAV9A850_ACOGR|nr:hypothetical protein QJS04_geneDACA019478 [Acorus gramineus]